MGIFRPCNSELSGVEEPAGELDQRMVRGDPGLGQSLIGDAKGLR